MRSELVQAYLTSAIDHLETAESRNALKAAAQQICEFIDVKPICIAHDMHPDFYSTQLALELADQLAVPSLAVQHHHAHIAAVCAEYGLPDTVIGVALDGLGLGDDGTLWGGELLIVNGASKQRIGHLLPMPLPGGDVAASEPWRMAAAALHMLGFNHQIQSRFNAQAASATVAKMLQRKLNCPLTSSTGRLFDCAAGLLGVSLMQSFEAEAAIKLQSLADAYGDVAPLSAGYTINHGVLSFLPLLANLAEEVNPSYGAALFHATLAQGLAQWVMQGITQYKINTLVLNGGCFLNARLLRLLKLELNLSEVTVLHTQQLLPDDSALSLGQAWVALKYIEGNV